MPKAIEVDDEGSKIFGVLATLMSEAGSVSVHGTRMHARELPLRDCVRSVFNIAQRHAISDVLHNLATYVERVHAGPLGPTTLAELALFFPRLTRTIAEYNGDEIDVNPTLRMCGKLLASNRSAEGVRALHRCRSRTQLLLTSHVEALLRTALQQGHPLRQPTVAALVGIVAPAAHRREDGIDLGQLCYATLSDYLETRQAQPETMLAVIEVSSVDFDARLSSADAACRARPASERAKACSRPITSWRPSTALSWRARRFVCPLRRGFGTCSTACDVPSAAIGRTCPALLLP